MMRTLYITIIISCFFCNAVGQRVDSLYEAAYNEITEMLEGEKEYSFKRAVFVTENAYMKGILSYQDIELEIKALAKISESIAKLNTTRFLYEGTDRETILLHASIFALITDTVTIVFENGKSKRHMPLTYDFEDPFGKEDWRNMLVSKLIYTGKGNCHSLPYLYKMIAEELGVSTNLALAPNHIYIKHKSEENGMYNTELTSGTFPIDAWLMASGYIHLDAVRSGLYMESLDNKQSLALCLVDLANGYERNGNGDKSFALKCCETALNHYPNYANAMLLKADILRQQFQTVMDNEGVKEISNVTYADAKKVFAEYEDLILQLHRLGYRKMPEKMYLDWLALLQTEKEKYANKNVIDKFNNLDTQ